MTYTEAITTVQALKVHGYEAFSHVNVQGDTVVEVLDPVKSSLHGTQFVQRYLKTTAEAAMFIMARS